MNINTVIDHLNKKYDINLDSSYYQNIAIWRDWWMGYYAPFHTFAEVGLDGKKKERKLYTLKMLKREKKTRHLKMIYSRVYLETMHFVSKVTG